MFQKIVPLIPINKGGEYTVRNKGGGYTAQLLGFEAVLAYDCLKIGTTLFGMQLQDVIKGLDYLFKREDLNRKPLASVRLPNIDQIGCIGWGVGGLLALYAAAIDERLEQVVAIESLCSYKALLDSPLYRYNFSTFIPDVIRRFDLCDVAALVAPRILMLINSVDAMKNPVPQNALEEHYAWTRKIYRFLKNPEGLILGDEAKNVVPTIPSIGIESLYLSQSEDRFNNPPCASI